MKSRERFTAVFNNTLPDDRLPAIEWASWWWDRTIMEWQKQGLPSNLGFHDVAPYLKLDQHYQFWFPHRRSDCPQPAFNGGPIAEDEEEYEKILPYLYPLEEAEAHIEVMKTLKAGHDNGDYPVWFSLDGGFWFPRTILGIENHLYSFYDQPELYHRMLDDLADFQLKLLEKMYAVITPDFMTFGEDMSYNNGPMISEDSFDEFLLPYYEKIVPYIKAHGTKVIVDTDGDVSKMIPWLMRAGIEGVLPLERQAGVDVVALRELYPKFIFIGAFDKMTMRRGVDDMRGEFERLLPVMKTGGFIPSCDHQTPPDVPLERYRIYVEMLKDYAEKAVKG